MRTLSGRAFQVATLRIAAYEFNYDLILKLVKEVLDTGVDIKIIYDARQDYPRTDNRAAVAAAGLENVSRERTRPKSYISHNKFIVKLEDGQPKSVWTALWDDPTSAPLKNSVEMISPLPQEPPPVGTTVLFSPRENLDALPWYANLAMNAMDGLFMTFAFGMNDIFKNVYENGLAPFRLALLEKATRSMKAGPERDAEERKMQILRNMPENVFAIGSFISTNKFDGWVMEKLTNLNSHVRYVHNEFMLVDPLMDDPIVIAGSANFSDASTRRNDENMVITRGNTCVADIYLGEFMRLYSHHAFRESLQWRDPDDPPKPLKTDDWWRDYFGQMPRSTRRKYFARSQI